jgi:hypothetical protein
MKVGIIGVGNMGSAFARRLSAAGHDVAVTSRNLDEAQKAATSAGGSVRAVPRQEIAANAEILILATPYAQAADALRASGDLTGKTIVDITNPVTPDYSALAVGFSSSAAEEIAKVVPGARVVKAFNTVFAQVLAARPGSGRSGTVQVFYAGDDDGAKAAVRSLIESIGLEPFDSGPLTNARYLEPLGMLTIYFGYSAQMGTDIAPSWQRVI